MWASSPLPNEWESLLQPSKASACSLFTVANFEEAVFWDYFGVTNIITDFVLILLPVNVLWDIQINKGRKVAILGCFASRLLYVSQTFYRATTS